MRFRVLLAFLAVFGVKSTVFAQKDTLKPKHLLLFPVIARSIETGWDFGTVGSYTFRISETDTISRTSNLQVLALYSTKKQLVTAINGSQYFNKEKFILNEQLSFSSYPDKFWGLGSQTAEAAEEPYKFKQTYVYLHLLRKIAPHFFTGLLFEMQNVWDFSYTAGGVFDKENIIGKEGYHIAGLGSSLTYDNRNNAFAPDKGLFCQLSFNHFDKFWGSGFNYTNIVLDLRKYIRLSDNHVLALQLFSFNNTGQVPIRSLASFGGASRMRGYYDGRYKDLDLLSFQAEFRFPIAKRFSAVAFGGGGDVGSQLRSFALADLKYSYGAGLRFALNKKEKLNLRLDYGIGQGSNSGLYLQLGEAF